MSKGGGGVSYPPERIFNAWADYGQTNQLSPFGSLIYTGRGADRTAHMLLPQWQLDALGRQAGLQAAAQNRLLSMFGGDAYNVSGPAPGEVQAWWEENGDDVWYQRPWEQYGMTREEWFLGPDAINNTDSGGTELETDGDGVSIPFNGGASSNWADLLEGTKWEGINWNAFKTGVTPDAPDWWTSAGNDPEAFSDWYWTKGAGSQGGLGVFSNYTPGMGAFFQHKDTPEMAGWFKDRFGDDANAQDRWAHYYWTKGGGAEEFGWGDEYGWQDLLSDYGITESNAGSVHRPDTDRRTSFTEPPGITVDPTQQMGGGFFESLMNQMGEIPELAWKIDWDKIPEIPGMEDFGAERDRVEKAQFQRMRNLIDPVYQQREDALLERLANQGLPVGSEIRNIETGNFGREYGQAVENAALQAILSGGQEQSRMFGLGLAGHQAGLSDQLTALGLQNQARSQGLGEMMGVQAQEYNQLMSLLGGSQVPYYGFGNFMGNGLGMGASDPFGLAIGQSQFGQKMQGDFTGGLMGMIGTIIAAMI